MSKVYSDREIRKLLEKVFKDAQVIYDNNFSFVSGLNVEQNNIDKKEYFKKLEL